MTTPPRACALLVMQLILFTSYSVCLLNSGKHRNHFGKFFHDKYTLSPHLLCWVRCYICHSSETHLKPQPRLPIIHVCGLVIKSLWHFVQSTAVTLPCYTRRLATESGVVDKADADFAGFHFMKVLERYPILQHPPLSYLLVSRLANQTIQGYSLTACQTVDTICMQKFKQAMSYRCTICCHSLKYTDIWGCLQPKTGYKTTMAWWTLNCSFICKCLIWINT